MDFAQSQKIQTGSTGNCDKIPSYNILENLTNQ